MIRSLPKNPVTLIEQGAPHRIHDEDTLTQYAQALFRLTAKEKHTVAERATIDLLTLLIEDYESKYRIAPANPLDVLKYLMEKGNLRQQDLRAELGSTSNISMILSGQRNLTLGNATALAARFKMDIRAFLPSPTGKLIQRKNTRVKSIQASVKSVVSTRARHKAVALQTV